MWAPIPFAPLFFLPRRKLYALIFDPWFGAVLLERPSPRSLISFRWLEFYLTSIATSLAFFLSANSLYGRANHTRPLPVITQDPRTATPFLKNRILRFRPLIDSSTKHIYGLSIASFPQFHEAFIRLADKNPNPRLRFSAGASRTPSSWDTHGERPRRCTA